MLQGVHSSDASYRFEVPSLQGTHCPCVQYVPSGQGMQVAPSYTYPTLHVGTGEGAAVGICVGGLNVGEIVGLGVVGERVG